MEAKRILIYGDSNTHGYRASDGFRFGPDERWTGVCQKHLDGQAVILNEGLNGRTTCHDEFGMEFRNGLSYIEPCIRTHLPLDVVCVMLGSNDLKAQFHADPAEIAENAARVLLKAKWVVDSKYPENTCRYVLMAPPEITGDMVTGPFAWDFEGFDTVEKSKAFAAAFRQEAERHGFLYFDVAAATKPGAEDGLHLDAENHRKLGDVFAKWILTIL